MIEIFTEGSDIKADKFPGHKALLFDFSLSPGEIEEHGEITGWGEQTMHVLLNHNQVLEIWLDEIGENTVFYVLKCDTPVIQIESITDKRISIKRRNGIKPEYIRIIAKPKNGGVAHIYGVSISGEFEIDPDCEYRYEFHKNFTAPLSALFKASDTLEVS